MGFGQPEIQLCQCCVPILQVLGRNNKKLRVRYDNGEEDDVLIEHVSPLDTLPVNFGEEEYPLAVRGVPEKVCSGGGKLACATPELSCYSADFFGPSKPRLFYPAASAEGRVL